MYIPLHVFDFNLLRSEFCAKLATNRVVIFVKLSFEVALQLNRTVERAGNVATRIEII